MKLAEHLRHEVIVLQPDMDVTGLKKIGDEVSEVLDYTPGELYVKQYIRPKYVQLLTELTNTVITASLPTRLLDKCMAGEEDGKVPMTFCGTSKDTCRRMDM